MADDSRPSILVIKLSDLAGFVLSVRAFQSIRAHHRDDHLVLLTTAPFERLARASGLFDEVWVDQHPALWRPDQWLSLAKRLRGGGFRRVYDLQRSHRSAACYRLFADPKPEWVGTHDFASHRYRPPADQVLHIADQEAAQLSQVGIALPDQADLGFIHSNLTRLQLPERYAILMPGGAHRPQMRWPAKQYAKLALALAARGFPPYLVGTAAERDALAQIEDRCPKARNLCGDTSLEDLAELARGASLAVGNDSGPMHLIAAVGAPSVVLFSQASDPRRSAPRGPSVKCIQCDDLSGLTLADVLRELPADIREAHRAAAES